MFYQAERASMRPVYQAREEIARALDTQRSRALGEAAEQAAKSELDPVPAQFRLRVVGWAWATDRCHRWACMRATTDVAARELSSGYMGMIRII